MKLAVVIVNYNSTPYLRRCLSDLYRYTREPDFRVIVVDNASSDEALDDLPQQYPRLELLRNPRNLGFAKACNQGVRCCSASYYLLLNPDCEVQEGAIDRCLQFLETAADAGIVGCRVENPDGTVQRACRRRIPRPKTAFYRLFGLSTLFPRHPAFSAYYVTDEQEADRPYPVEAVSGSFLMFRQAVLEETGGLDEDFFLYGEDLDFCYRVSQAGWRIYYHPGAAVTHYKRASSSRDPRNSLFHFYDAMRIFYEKHYGVHANPLERFLVLAGIEFLYRLRLVRGRLTGRYEVGSAN
ncbi:MAG TPA: glycosyltransferase family 2 protein [Acidobacteriota bacterium]|nr:glycosyltransferase family 2 protein [Acidobacteriota bacterium]